MLLGKDNRFKIMFDLRRSKSGFGHLETKPFYQILKWIQTTIVSKTDFCFSDIPYLRGLKFDRNPIQKVEANAFQMIPQLVSLDLSHCNIKRVAARAFAQLNSLEKLFLQHNHISELRQKTVESITGKSLKMYILFVGKICGRGL